jgi:hypothetical protein
MPVERSPPAHLTSLWLVAGLAMGPAVALGLARFAYALLLPTMREALGWSYANAGAINTAITAVCIAASGPTANFAALICLRTLAGVTGALAFVSGGSITASVSGSAARAPLDLAIYFAGGGFGAAMSSLTIAFQRERRVA